MLSQFRFPELCRTVAGCLLLVACGGVDADDHSEPSSDAPSELRGDSHRRAPDPFAEQRDTSAGLVNISTDLDEILEHGELDGACDRYWGGDRSRRAKLLCGKSMFFDQTFGSPGVFKPLVNFLLENFSEEVGPALSNFGLIADPRSTEGLPLGLAPSSHGTVSFTCATCHFSQTPDGRYVVGAPNYGFEYGKYMLAMSTFPSVALLGSPETHDLAALGVIKPLLDRLLAQPELQQGLLTALLPLITAGGPPTALPPQTERAYATWRSGTMDVLIEPLPFNDHAHTVAKILPLWGFPTAAELRAFDMPSMFLFWSGGIDTLRQAEHGFMVFTGGDTAAWPEEKTAPLTDFVLSLRAPSSSSERDCNNRQRQANAKLERQGKKLFSEKGCLSCHDGPRGMGRELYSFDEIGTDRALERWLDPDGSGEQCCGLPSSTYEPGQLVTHKIKAPKLAGVWTADRLLHNGSVSSLEELFCYDGPRGGTTEEPYGSGGHRYTCDGLSRPEKAALIAYLRTL